MRGFTPFLSSPASGRTNIELREQLSRPEGVTQALSSFTSKRPTVKPDGSGVSKPSVARGSHPRGTTTEKPPSGPRTRPRLDVPSSGYGIRREKSGELRTSVGGVRREKSGELRPPSAASKQRSGSNIRGSSESLSTTRKISRTGVKKTDSQTSIWEHWFCRRMFRKSIAPDVLWNPDKPEQYIKSWDLQNVVARYPDPILPELVSHKRQ